MRTWRTTTKQKQLDSGLRPRLFDQARGVIRNRKLDQSRLSEVVLVRKGAVTLREPQDDFIS